MIVLDTSIFTDYLILFEEDRHRKAREVFNEMSKSDFILYEPFLFEIELTGILSRKYSKERITEILERIKNKIEVVDEVDLHEISLSVAMETHCRAIDSYFVATAKLTNSILITNDRVMAYNAKKYGIEAYYLLEEFDKAVERLKEIR
ncbi:MULTISPECIES: type II toxin-antitoxin system VapC family toxin [unclassified Archaeoglobus]|jgi:hypothetical protein|uniref:type II toxin-antitoxin system VapC family toxin n=1 Tax=unclassified Archaeoglobus TaxID=2643606 RepID=UPI0025C583EF|nr:MULTISPECIES: type II toxin-antitoxin system VapC family toxin [unclassified Archaeoglobus]